MEEMTEFRLTKSQVGLLGMGTQLVSGNKTYCFLPFWFEKITEDNIFKIHRLGELPEELKHLINYFREETGDDL